MILTNGTMLERVMSKPSNDTRFNAVIRIIMIRRQQRYDHLHTKFHTQFGKLRYGQSRGKSISVLFKADITSG